MYRLLKPALESLGARAEGGLLYRTLLRGWIMVHIWEVKRQRHMTSALMLLAALAVISLVPGDSMRVPLWGTLWERGFVARWLFLLPFRRTMIVTPAEDVPWRRSTPTHLALVLLPPLTRASLKTLGRWSRRKTWPR